MRLTNYEKEKAVEALEETNRFIKKESARNPDLRPPEIEDLLNNYIAHKKMLIQMLADDVVAVYEERFSI
jgi:hypothetical protein